MRIPIASRVIAAALAVLFGCGSDPSRLPAPQPVLWAAGCGSPNSISCLCGQAYSYCEQGVLAHSDDLGETWSHTFFERGLGSVDFPSPSNGWAVGAAGFVVRSTDGGRTWVRKVDGIQVPAAATARGLYAFNTVRFLDANRGIIAGRGGTDEIIAGSDAGFPQFRAEIFVLLTSDGGETWAPATIIGGASGIANDAYPHSTYASTACFAGEGLGVIAGRPSLLTRDGGLTWQNIMERSQLANPRGGLGAACDASGTLWLTSAAGRVVRSEDQGETWTVVADGLPISYDAKLEFATHARGWRAGSGEIRRTDDGGRSWGVVDAAIPEIFELVGTIRFATPKDGLWTTSGIGGVTHDGGATWRVVPIVNYRFGYFWFPDVAVVWPRSATGDSVSPAR